MADQVIADRYEVLSKLGSGGAAIVYKVKDLSLKNICALKTLRYEEPKPEQLIRFQREARSISGLKHPNIVSTLDFGMDKSNRPFLVMEYIEGVSLKQFLKRNGPLETEVALDIIEQVCSALAYVHSNDVLHRDIKSENIMVVGASAHKKHVFEENKELKVVLLDFGLAKDFEDSIGKGLTKAGVAMGTPMYMSPEQCAGNPVDVRSEVYSVGCLMYELLTGVYPLKGGTALETISMHQDIEAPSLNASNCGIEFDEEIESVVAKTLEKDPSKRFANMEELKLELQVLLRKDVDFLESNNQDFQDEYEDISNKQFSLDPESSNQTKLKPALLAVTALLVVCSVVLGYRVLNRESTVITTKKRPPEVSMFDLKPDTSNRFITFPGDSGISFHVFSTAPKTTDEELRSVDQGSFPKVLSVCKQKKITTDGLSYLAKLPFVGIGLNERQLTGEQLRLFARPDSKLEIIWMKDNPQIKDKDLEVLKKLPHLKYLSLTENNITDEALKHVADIPSLVTLKIIEERNMDGSGLKYLQKTKTLRNLCMQKNRLSLEGWKQLSKLKQLRILNIAKTNLTEQSIPNLKALNLEKLDISKNKLNDKALASIYSMKSLKLLLMHSCWGVTSEGVKELKLKLPNCKIRTTRVFAIDGIDPLLKEKITSI